MYTARLGQDSGATCSPARWRPVAGSRHHLGVTTGFNRPHTSCHTIKHQPHAPLDRRPLLLNTRHAPDLMRPPRRSHAAYWLRRPQACILHAGARCVKCCPFSLGIGVPAGRLSAGCQARRRALAYTHGPPVARAAALQLHRALPRRVTVGKLSLLFVPDLSHRLPTRFLGAAGSACRVSVCWAVRPWPWLLTSPQWTSAHGAAISPPPKAGSLASVNCGGLPPCPCYAAARRAAGSKRP